MRCSLTLSCLAMATATVTLAFAAPSVAAAPVPRRRRSLSVCFSVLLFCWGLCLVCHWNRNRRFLRAAPGDNNLVFFCAHTSYAKLCTKKGVKNRCPFFFFLLSFVHNTLRLCFTLSLRLLSLLYCGINNFFTIWWLCITKIYSFKHLTKIVLDKRSQGKSQSAFFNIENHQQQVLQNVGKKWPTNKCCKTSRCKLSFVCLMIFWQCYNLLFIREFFNKIKNNLLQII